MVPVERFGPVRAAELHELACTGPTPEAGCVCVTKPRSPRMSTTDNHLYRAGQNRKRSSELVDGIEVLMRKLDMIPAIPLDVLDRYERLIVRAHTANLLRLPTYGSLDES